MRRSIFAPNQRKHFFGAFFFSFVLLNWQPIHSPFLKRDTGVMPGQLTRSGSFSHISVRRLFFILFFPGEAQGRKISFTFL